MGNLDADAASIGLTPRRRTAMLILLTLIGTFSATDRAIIATVLEAVKRDFTLNDAQLGLLAGLAFSITYGFVAIPAGALADRVNRRKLIAAALASWSLLTALAGVASNFVHLLLSRMGVGAGEAAGQPALLSSVADLYPAERRSTAIAIYYLSAPASLLVAGAGGGLITAHYGWRAAMVMVAAPGLLLSMCLWLFCPDLPRRQPLQASAAKARAPSLATVLRFVVSQKSLVHLIIAIALVNVVTAGVGTFGFSFFLRYHDMSLGTLGPILGSISAVVMLLTILGSGWFADRVGAQDPRRRLWLIAIMLVIATPVVMLGCVLPQPYALPLFLGHLVITGVWLGPATATTQNLSHPTMRATVAAIIFVTTGVIGVGMGPILTGTISDFWSNHSGTDGLRVALMATTFLGFWAALHFYLATRSLGDDLQRVGEFNGGG